LDGRRREGRDVEGGMSGHSSMIFGPAVVMESSRALPGAGQ
jgi:hypothetical protein